MCKVPAVPTRHRIYLVPGFFGFANLGEFVYFGHVRDFLEAELHRRTIRAEVIPVALHPTASSLVRARDLLGVIEATCGAEGPLHLVGHSTGALDARLLIAPGTPLGEPPVPAEILERIHSVVTVSAPHQGTPLSSFFRRTGGPLLQLLSIFTVLVLRRGRLPASILLRLVGAIVRADDFIFRKPTLVDQLFAELLGDLSLERRESLVQFFEACSKDQSLIVQLSPDRMPAFMEHAVDRLGVRYGSVVTCAQDPTFRARLALGLSPYAQASHTLYAFLHRQTEKHGPTPTVSSLSPVHAAALEQAYGRLPGPGDNDGIVPTLSQPYGKLICAVSADHLDAIGHFDDPSHQPPHVDWLLSGSGFRRPQFEALWTRVASFLLDS